jgi:hypothetical protein
MAGRRDFPMYIDFWRQIEKTQVHLGFPNKCAVALLLSET